MMADRSEMPWCVVQMEDLENHVKNLGDFIEDLMKENDALEATRSNMKEEILDMTDMITDKDTHFLA